MVEDKSIQFFFWTYLYFTKDIPTVSSQNTKLFLRDRSYCWYNKCNCTIQRYHNTGWTRYVNPCEEFVRRDLRNTDKTMRHAKKLSITIIYLETFEFGIDCGSFLLFLVVYCFVCQWFPTGTTWRMYYKKRQWFLERRQFLNEYCFYNWKKR